MADTSTTLVFIRTHPLFLADTSTLGLGCTHSVLGRHMWHFSLQLYTHPVLGRHQCQVSLQSDSPSTLADTSVRSVFSQTHPPLWQTPVSGQSSVRLTLISEACWLHTASSLADMTVCAVFRRVMACCILVISSIIFFWRAQSAEHHRSANQSIKVVQRKWFKQWSQKRETHIAP